MLKELLQSLFLCFYRKRVSEGTCVAYFERIAATGGAIDRDLVIDK